MKSRIALFVWIGMILGGCGDLNGDNTANDGLFIASAQFDFSQSQNGWEADFADYPADTTIDSDTNTYALKAAYMARPANLGRTNAMMLSGNNNGEQLFMFIKRKITGLAADVNYTLVFDVELASELPARGAGKDVFLKVGATHVEPKKMIDSNGNYVLNIDKGENLETGEDMMVLGNIGLPEASKEFVLISRSNNQAATTPFIAKSNSRGELWLIVGTESHFKGVTTVYYSKINIVLSSSR